MANLKMLVDEIDLIVTAPYLVDIAALHKVTQSVGEDAIRQWCRVKACQLPKLVSYLVKFLFEDRGVETFECFCQAPGFSKAVVDNRPELLQQLIARALNEPWKSRTNMLCCGLLAAQHLHGVPAELPRYLEKIMRATHHFPTAALLRAIREIVAKQTALVFELVSEDVLVEFIQTCKLLTKDNTSNWHEAAILSINIGSAVCEEVFLRHSEYRQNFSLQKGSEVFCEWAVKMLGYFDGVKAVRFIHSIVARVMFFTSRNQNIPMPTRATFLDIVLETLERFRYGVMEFAAENPDAVEKVYRNAAGEHLDFDARLSAFAVAYKITPEGMYIDNVEAVLQQLVAVLVSEDESCTLYLHDNAPSQAKQLTDCLCSLLDIKSKNSPELMNEIVNFILNQCRACQHPDIDTYAKTCTALILLRALFESMKKHHSIFTLLMTLIKPDSPEFNPWMPYLPCSSEPVLMANCRGSLACTHDLPGLRQELRSSLGIVLLHGACTTTSKLSTKEFAILQERALFRKPDLDSKKCQYPAEVENSAFLPPPSLFPRIEGDWRQQIVDIMGDFQRQSAEAVLDQVNTVCHELERRCETVEEPLRQAQSHAARLQEALDQTRSRLDKQEATNSALVQKLEQDGITIDEKDVEISTLKQQIDKLQVCSGEQNDRIAQLTVETASLKQEYASEIIEILAEATRVKQDLETLNKAERFTWEEQLEAEKQNVVKQAADIAWLESEKHKLLDEQKADHQIYQETMKQMKFQHEQAYNEVVEQTAGFETKLNGRDTEVSELKQAVNEHEEQLRGKTEQLHKFEQSEREWLREKSDLQERLEAAEAKERKVLAAIRGEASQEHG